MSSQVRAVPLVAAAVATHLLLTAAVGSLLVSGPVTGSGYDGSGPSGLAAAPALVVVAIAVTLPPTLLEGVAVRAHVSRPRAALVLAGAALAAIVHGWVAALPVTFRLAGAGPVAREEVGRSVVLGLAIVLVHAVVLLVVARRRGAAPAVGAATAQPDRSRSSRRT